MRVICSGIRCKVQTWLNFVNILEIRKVKKNYILNTSSLKYKKILFILFNSSNLSKFLITWIHKKN